MLTEQGLHYLYCSDIVPSGSLSCVHSDYISCFAIDDDNDVTFDFGT